MINMENLEWYIRRELNKAGEIRLCRGRIFYYHRFGNLLFAMFGNFSVKMCNYINKRPIPLNKEEEGLINSLVQQLTRTYMFDYETEEVEGIE